jgi:hypothetical protein
MSTSTKALPLTKAALTAAEQEARKHGEPAAQTGDTCLKGSTRRAVVKAAIASLSDKEQDAVVAASNDDIHRYIGGVLKHSGCLLETVEGYLETVNQEGYLDSHAPSVIGPEGIRRHIAAERKAKEPKQPKAEKPKAEKKAKEPKTKTPPKKSKAALPTK